MEKVYLDKTMLNQCTAVFVAGAEVIPTGVTIHSMSHKDKNEEYQRYAEEYDIHFIFDDDIPNLGFYTVPQVDVVARDSEDGYIGAVGEDFDLDSDVPICYINRNRECFLIAHNGEEFIKNAASWKVNLKPYNDITFYPSKEEAEKDRKFVDVKEIHNLIKRD